MRLLELIAATAVFSYLGVAGDQPIALLFSMYTAGHATLEFFNET